MSDVIGRLLSFLTVEFLTVEFLTVESRRVYLTLALIIMPLLPEPSLGVAQEQEAKELPRVTHTSPDGRRLPHPGVPLPLEVTIVNTQQVDQRLRVVAVQDGELFDFSVNKSTVDLQDHPHYIVSLYAPLKELSYQFFLYDKSGEVIASPKYTIKRECQPVVDLVTLPLPEEQKGDPKTMSNVAARLEKEIEAYENAAKLLVELEQELSKSQ